MTEDQIVARRRRKKELKAEYKAKGLCTQCGKRPLVSATFCGVCLEEHNKQNCAYKQRQRRLVLDHYGAPYCACCNDRFDYEFLHVNHVGGWGAEHHHILSDGGKKKTTAHDVIMYIIANDFPPGFNVLCAGCNMADGAFGECPHVKQRREMLTKLAAMPLTY